MMIEDMMSWETGRSQGGYFIIFLPCGLLEKEIR